MVPKAIAAKNLALAGAVITNLCICFELVVTGNYDIDSFGVSEI